MDAAYGYDVFNEDYYHALKIYGDKTFEIEDPTDPNSVIVGYKGKEVFDTGIVYAPYTPLYTTPTLEPNQFFEKQQEAKTDKFFDAIPYRDHWIVWQPKTASFSVYDNEFKDIIADYLSCEEECKSFIDEQSCQITIPHS